jgi:hypothetical protein
MELAESKREPVDHVIFALRELYCLFKHRFSVTAPVEIRKDNVESYGRNSARRASYILLETSRLHSDAARLRLNFSDLPQSEVRVVFGVVAHTGTHPFV